jgi:hypothetical protein
VRARLRWCLLCLSGHVCVCWVGAVGAVAAAAGSTMAAAAWQQQQHGNSGGSSMAAALAGHTRSCCHTRVSHVILCESFLCVCLSHLAGTGTTPVC